MTSSFKINFLACSKLENYAALKLDSYQKGFDRDLPSIFL